MNRQWPSLGASMVPQGFLSCLSWLVTVVFLPGGLFAQPDTAAIARQLDGLVSIESHRAWWTEVYQTDQIWRGHLTVDSLDNLNLVRVAMYFNRFGLPDKSLIGQPANAVRLVWIHNKYPRTTAWTFPLILERYRHRATTEFDLRDYYLRSLYRRQFAGEGYRTRPLGELFRTLDLNTAQRIDIPQLLTLITEEEAFLRQPVEILGTWQGDATRDTLPLAGQPLALEFQDDPIRIFRDSSGAPFLHRLYADGSHYPQLLIQPDPTQPVFRLYPQDDPVYILLDNGDLEERINGQTRVLSKKD